MEDLSLEDLVNIKVTSVSKREQNLREAAAAIFVLDNHDLLRSGTSSIADALRIVPGMNVGGVNSSQWAVSGRGFNHLYANKLLVLVDGRTVYNPFWSGVFWDLQRPMLEDVDRIEVIRGPGATIWGANAVNGVINVVSQSAKDTQGGLIYGGGGDVNEFTGGIRYGGQTGNQTYYRVFAGYHKKSNYLLADGTNAHDNWDGWQGGFRLDHYPDLDTQFTWQADLTTSDLYDGTSEAYNFNTIGRWNREWRDRSSSEVQVYFDRTYRDETNRANVSNNTYDISADHTLGLGDHHDIIMGAGYRQTSTQVKRLYIPGTISNGEQKQDLFSAFVQDEIKLVPERVTLTAGIKVEHSETVGFEYQPSVRVVLNLSDNQILWSAISRAVRTPSLVEAEDMVNVVYGQPFQGPGGGFYLPTVSGNPDVNSERLWAYELGYRINPNRRTNLDIALFYNRYKDIITISGLRGFLPGNPFGIGQIVFDNLLYGETYGGEFAFDAEVSDTWKIHTSYSLLRMTLNSDDPMVPASIAGDSPEHQFVFRSSHQLSRRATMDLQARYVDSIRGVSSYFTADFQLSCQLNDHFLLSLVGQNLLDNQQPEQAEIPATITSEVSRSIYGKVTWRF